MLTTHSSNLLIVRGLNRVVSILRLALLSILMVTSGLAATVSWVAGSGNWNTPTNWSTGVLPGPTDDVVISPTNASIFVTHSGSHTINSLMSQVAFQLTGGTLTISNTCQVNNVFSLSGGILG